MTLVIALTNEKEAVLVADTLCCYQSEQMWYVESNEYKKIHHTINPKFVVGVAGQSSAVALLEKVKARQRLQKNGGIRFDTFQSVLRSTQQELEKEYTQGEISFGSPINFLFVGFDDEGPALYLVVCEERDNKKSVSEARFCGSRKAVQASGAHPHGALYVLYRFMNKEMSAESLIALGAYCINATSESQPDVNARLNFAVVGQNHEDPEIQTISENQTAELRDRIDKVSELISQPLS